MGRDEGDGCATLWVCEMPLPGALPNSLCYVNFTSVHVTEEF